jgi:hypothetical protein
MSERLNEVSPLAEWHPNLLVASHFTDLLVKEQLEKMGIVKGKILVGYCQGINTHRSFSLSTFCHLQLKCIKNTPYKSREFRFDASGNLVKIQRKLTQDMGEEYKRTLNYFGLLKNTETQKSTLVCELITSSHNVNSLNTFFGDIKYKYEEIFYPQSLHFRLFIIDYAWASIHSAIEVFNKDSVPTYSINCYKLASGDTTLLDSENYTWLGSCVSHTMKRFADSLKKLQVSAKQKRYVCFCFSLLLNSTTLDEISTYFEKICLVFLSEKVKD